MLIFDPVSSGFNGYNLDPANPSDYHLGFTQDISSVLSQLQALSHCDDFGYVIHQGANVFTDPVTRLDDCCNFPASFDSRSGSVPPMVRELIQICQQIRPGARHSLLCETGFFSHMPLAAASYAIPRDLYDKGYRRFGGDGLTHQWAWNQIQSRFSLPHPARVITIHFCDHPSLASIQDGQAVDSSMGYSDLEGLPSLTSCGSIDPAIVLDLSENGLSPAEITSLLSEKSGFLTLVSPQFTHLGQIISDDSASTRLAHDIFFHKTIESIGAAAAELQGLDALVFIVEDINGYDRMINEIGEQLSFIGISLKVIPDSSLPAAQLSPRDSSPGAFLLQSKRRDILASFLQH